MKQYKAFQFRLLPTKEQTVLLAKTFGSVRFVYNKMLVERKETYAEFKDDKATLKKQKFPTPATYKEAFPFLKEVDALALANAQRNLQKAYKNFYEHRASFPRFKSCKHKQSYTTNQVNGNIACVERRSYPIPQTKISKNHPALRNPCGLSFEILYHF
ncbi:transposase [Gracilibacillus alcaliphilus]|nr:transposase [Gracilibacillus alcaliphilus]